MAHFLNHKAQAFFTREPRDLAHFLAFLFLRIKKKNRSPRNAAGQAAKKGSREDQDPFATCLPQALRLCVKKKDYLPAMLRDRQASLRVCFNKKKEYLAKKGSRKEIY